MIKSKDFSYLAKRDNKVKKLYKYLEKGIYAIELDTLQNEIEKLHYTRLSRSLKTQDIINNFQRKFLEAVLQNQAYRSRATELKMKVLKVNNKLVIHLEVIRSYLKTTYSDQLRQYKTIGDRSAAIDSILEEPIRLNSKFENFMAFCDVAIEDIDQTGWALKYILQAVELNAGGRSSNI